MPHQKMLKLAGDGHVCAQCGGRLLVAWGGGFGYNCYILRCLNDVGHVGVRRDFELRPSQTPGFNLFDAGRRRRKGMEQRYGEDNIKALAKYEGLTSLTEAQAREVVTTIWPEAERASPAEVFKAVKLCTQYGLNPLMRHLFLVPFWNKDKKRYDFECIQSITSNRLIASRKHRWTFLDDTPRTGTAEEVKKHYGQHVSSERIYCIARMKDLDTGAEVTGWGEWPVWKVDRDGKKVRNEPKGVDKGNSMINMACIHAERNGLDKLYPAEMPPSDIRVMDESEALAYQVRAEQPDNPPVEQSSDESHQGEGASEQSTEAEERGREEKQEKADRKEKRQKPLRDPDTINSMPALQKALADDFGLDDKAQRAELNIRYWSDLAVKPSEAFRQVAATR